MAAGTFRSLKREHRRELEDLGPNIVVRKMQEASVKTSRGCRDIIQKFMHKMKEFSSMSNYVVQRLLRRAREL